MRIRKDFGIDKEEIELIASVSDALGHPARVEIFRFIYKANSSREEVCNKTLVENFDYAQATISQHVKKLTDSGLLEIKKVATSNFYYVNIGVLSKYLNAVKKLNQL